MYVCMFTAEEDETDKEKRLTALMENLKMRAGQLRSSVELAKLPQIDITVGHKEQCLVDLCLVYRVTQIWLNCVLF